MTKEGILLESGTNELEIVEFSIGDSFFGINVIKVREVVNSMQITKIPESHPSMEGVIKIRGEVIPLVNLVNYLGYPPSGNSEDDKIIVAEFNSAKVAFLVHQVSRIHRISWDQIHKPPSAVSSVDSCTIGIVKFEENKMVLLLDFEKIMSDISPEMIESPKDIEKSELREAKNKSILIAEDSPTLRTILNDYLPGIGYKNLNFFENGLLAWEYLDDLANTMGEKFSDKYQLVITDIEMPQMDGHHLTKKIKDHPILRRMPVVIFSSLITDDLRHKGEKVGADAQISKPQYRELSDLVDELIL